MSPLWLDQLISRTLAAVESRFSNFIPQFSLKTKIKSNSDSLDTNPRTLKSLGSCSKELFIALDLIFLSKDQTQNNASVRCFVFSRLSYAVVKVLLEIKLIAQFEPSILSTKL